MYRRFVRHRHRQGAALVSAAAARSYGVLMGLSMSALPCEWTYGAADQFMPFAGKGRPIGAVAVRVGWNGPIIGF